VFGLSIASRFMRGALLGKKRRKEKVMNNIIEKIEIENDDLKALAQEMVLTIPEYWYHVGASSSGKYHPAYSLGEGGLMRHTIALVRILNYLFESSDEFTSRERDILRIAGMMHDTRKSGDQKQYEKNHYTKHEHPILAAEVVRTFKGRGYNDCEIETIATTIEAHMGKWNTSNYSDVILPVPQNRLQTMLHQADFLASRKDITIAFTDLPTNKEEAVNEEKPTVMPFGKYKGKRLCEIILEDSQYLSWCLKNLDLKDSLRSAIEDVIAN
jgi:hypothetical protein